MTVLQLRLTCNKETTRKGKTEMKKQTGILNTINNEGRTTMKKLTKKACAFTLFTMMTLSPLGLASAETTAVPEAPEKPYVENYQDNDRINKYNSLVDSYNEAAQNYNLAVDEEYNNAVDRKSVV